MTSLKAVLLAAAFALPASLAFAATEAAAPFTDQQKTAIETVVRELLTKKEPEIVMKAAQELQEKMEKEAAAKGKEAVGKNRESLFNDPRSPVGGNPKGDVTIVEFFDYTCGYCKMGQENLVKFIKQDKNVRLVYKEFPILGPASVFASKAALASVSQGKYSAFHEALMTSKERLSEETVKKIAKDVGLNVEKLLKDMESDKIDAMLKDNKALALELNIQGTPGFVIGENTYPGVLSLDQLKAAIETVRKAH